jgi:phenylalanyl-tRNA synthetase alpha chain
LNKVKIKDIKLTALGKELMKVKLDSKNVIDRLDSSMLKSGSWKNKKFRGYDVSINVPNVYGGKSHFVSQAIDYIRKIWLELGFKEMKGNLIQTGFWDLDSLFVPQDHPARQMQDTFYIKEPAEGKLPDIWKKIKSVHENGADTGSTGWGGEWSEKTAKENLLRTHTTVLSAQTIANLKKEDLPAKFFSVGKVFRNEALDWKHLFELTQVEGIVVDPNANFKHLIGYLKEFFSKMGYEDVRVRPGHFPYTEPSAEVDVYDPVKKKWIELGGSGIFRPEVTKPLLGFECPVLAWGLGMERIISEYWNISDIRHLYKNDLKQIREMKYWMK